MEPRRQPISCPSRADWPWSSTRALLAGEDDGVVTVAPVLETVGDFSACLEGGEYEAAVMAIRRSRSTGRPVGSAGWLAALESAAGRPLAAARRGPRPKAGGKGARGDLFRHCHRNRVDNPARMNYIMQYVRPVAKSLSARCG